MIARSRALATAGVTCLAALAVAGCSQTGSSSSSSSVTITGHSLTIYISDPKSLQKDPAAQDVVHAEELAFKRFRSEVKDYSLTLRVARSATVSDNARNAIINKTAIAYLGEIQPGISDQTVGITNTLDLLQVSPTDTALELGQHTPAVADSPKTYFEDWGTYDRTFARVVPSGAEEATAQVAKMKALGVSSLYVSSDGSDYGRALAAAVTGDARTAGITVQSSSSGASGDFYAAQDPAAAARFFNRIAAQSPNAKLFGPSSLNSSVFTSKISPTAKNLYVSIPGFLPQDLPAGGRSFTAAFRAQYGHEPNAVAIFGYEAMSAVLRVLKQAGHGANNRGTVVKDFLAQHRVSSALGTYSINSSGNTSLDAFVFAHMQAGKLVPFTAAPTTS